MPAEVKAARHKRFMLRAAGDQREEARGEGRQAACRSIVDEGGAHGGKGRTKGDAPQIDGAVHVATRRPLRAGDIVTVKIDRADAYDLWGTAV